MRLRVHYTHGKSHQAATRRPPQIQEKGPGPPGTLQEGAEPSAKVAARGPIDTTGKKATLPHHFVFNMLAFGEKFDHLVSILDWLSMMVYEDFQSQAEAYHELQQIVSNGP